MLLVCIIDIVRCSQLEIVCSSSFYCRVLCWQWVDFTHPLYANSMFYGLRFSNDGSPYENRSRALSIEGHVVNRSAWFNVWFWHGCYIIQSVEWFFEIGGRFYNLFKARICMVFKHKCWKIVFSFFSFKSVLWWNILRTLTNPRREPNH